MEFNEKLRYYADIVNRRLDKAVDFKCKYEKIVVDAMKYSINAGGKRVRPVLTLAVCDMLGGNIDNAANAAAAIELIHTYSLIHDDLPCIDNDDLRRGKPTCHKVYGEDIALLAGDALLTLAFSVISDNEGCSLKPETMLSIIKTVADESGVLGMIGGQVIDVVADFEDMSPDKIKYMHEQKTGALITCAALCGALCAGANSAEQDKITEFAKKMGLAFQIKDDILDCVGDPSKMGKAAGSDLANKKPTFVSLMGLQKAEEYLVQLTEESICALSDFGDNSEFLNEFVRYLLNREN